VQAEYPSSQVRAAYLAAGGTWAAAQAVLRGEVQRSFALVRPPGHHAEPERAMGFCLFNNVAVAVALSLEREEIRRIAVLDWDLHHGNGTQAVFINDPRVLFVSLHQVDTYPGTGDTKGSPTSPSEGSPLNIALPRGSGNAEYERICREQVEPRLRAFEPDLIFVSAGFDAYYLDDLGQMQMTAQGYARLIRWLRQIADAVCLGRLVLVLEGGYHPEGLARCVAEVIEALLEERPV